MNLKKLSIVIFSLATSVAFTAAHAFGIRVEGMCAFALELSVFLYEHLDADANEDNCHDDYRWNQDIKKCTHDYSAIMR